MLRLPGCFPLALIVCLSSVISARADEGYLLRYKFQPGMFIHLEIRDQNEILAEYNNRTQKHSNTAVTWKHYRVISVDENGQAVLEMLNDRVTMEWKFDENPAETIDTANPGANPNPKFQPVMDSTGKPLARTEVNARGELVKLTPLVAEIPATAEASNFLVVFPEGSVKVGAQWKETFETPVTVGKNLKQNVSMIREYTLSKVDGNRAHIKLRVQPKGYPGDPQLEMQLMQRLITAEIVFDLERGLILSQHNRVDHAVINPLGPGSKVSAVGDYLLKLTDGPPALTQAVGNKTETK